MSHNNAVAIDPEGISPRPGPYSRPSDADMLGDGEIVTGCTCLSISCHWYIIAAHAQRCLGLVVLLACERLMPENLSLSSIAVGQSHGCWPGASR